MQGREPDDEEAPGQGPPPRDEHSTSGPADRQGPWAAGEHGDPGDPGWPQQYPEHPEYPGSVDPGPGPGGFDIPRGLFEPRPTREEEEGDPADPAAPPVPPVSRGNRPGGEHREPPESPEPSGPQESPEPPPVPEARTEAFRVVSGRDEPSERSPWDRPEPSPPSSAPPPAQSPPESATPPFGQRSPFAPYPPESQPAPPTQPWQPARPAEPAQPPQPASDDSRSAADSGGWGGQGDPADTPAYGLRIAPQEPSPYGEQQSPPDPEPTFGADPYTYGGQEQQGPQSQPWQQEPQGPQGPGAQSSQWPPNAQGQPGHGYDAQGASQGTPPGDPYSGYDEPPHSAPRASQQPDPFAHDPYGGGPYRGTPQQDPYGEPSPYAPHPEAAGQAAWNPGYPEYDAGGGYGTVPYADPYGAGHGDPPAPGYPPYGTAPDFGHQVPYEESPYGAAPPYGGPGGQAHGQQPPAPPYGTPPYGGHPPGGGGTPPRGGGPGSYAGGGSGRSGNEPPPPSPSYDIDHLYPVRGKGGGRRGLLVASLVLVVILIVGGGAFFVYNTLGQDSPDSGPVANVSNSPSQPPPSSTSPSPPPSPTFDEAQLRNAKTDSKPLALKEMFPKKRITVGGDKYELVRKRLDKKCPKAGQQSFGKALRKADCRRVLRATFVEAKKKPDYAFTMGVAVLPNQGDAKQVKKAAKAGKRVWFKALPGPKKSKATNIHHSEGYSALEVMGRYVVFSFAAHADGAEKPKKKDKPDKGLGRLSSDSLEKALNPIIDRGMVTPSPRP